MKYVDDVVNLLANLGIVFNRLPNKEKGGFLRVIFPENIMLENEGCRTNSNSYRVSDDLLEFYLYFSSSFTPISEYLVRFKI